ncbi:MAG: ankyrin repeat domain-containing protein [Limisphaerales bacterium]
MKPSTWLIVLVVVSAMALAFVATTRRTPGPGRYALFRAVGDGDLEKVRGLVQQGAPINERDPGSFGPTVLIWAIYQDKINIAHYLIKAGANVNLADKNGETPLMWAVTVGDSDVPLAKDLIAHGARLDAKEKDGFTVFDQVRADPPRPEMATVLEAARLEQQRQSHK